MSVEHGDLPTASELSDMLDREAEQIEPSGDGPSRFQSSERAESQELKFIAMELRDETDIPKGNRIKTWSRALVNEIRRLEEISNTLQDDLGKSEAVRVSHRKTFRTLVNRYRATMNKKQQQIEQLNGQLHHLESELKGQERSVIGKNGQVCTANCSGAPACIVLGSACRCPSRVWPRDILDFEVLGEEEKRRGGQR
jgi:chromosome segregation ATPase